MSKHILNIIFAASIGVIILQFIQNLGLKSRNNDLMDEVTEIRKKVIDSLEAANKDIDKKIEDIDDEIEDLDKVIDKTEKDAKEMDVRIDSWDSADSLERYFSRRYHQN